MPGNNRSVCRQFLRVVTHQLVPLGLPLQLFNSEIDNGERGIIGLRTIMICIVRADVEFFKAIVTALQDFSEVSPVEVLRQFFEMANNDWSRVCMARALHNIGVYMQVALSKDTFLSKSVLKGRPN